MSETWQASVPASVCDVIAALRSAGHPAWLGGESLHGLMCGLRPGVYEVATSAAPDRVLDLFARAVPTRPEAAIVCLPTPDGPIDIASFRNGSTITADLAQRAFTIHAMAYDPHTRELVDPYAGRADVAERRLRGVGPARLRMVAQPIDALRAVRLVATHGYGLDPELEAALKEARLRPSGAELVRIRDEVTQLLLAPGAAKGLALLHRSGIAEQLAPGARPDGAALVAALPAELAPRLAAWLRGANAGRAIRRLGIGSQSGDRARLLLRNHPIDEVADPRKDGSVRRLLRQLGEANVARLVRMRELEIGLLEASEAARTRAQLEALLVGLDRVRTNDARRRSRQALALDGREVMAVLRCRPGKRVGSALHFLGQLIAEDPTLNEPETLRAQLVTWSARCPE